MVPQPLVHGLSRDAAAQAYVARGRRERNALYIASYASHIVGIAIEEGQALLAELIEFATQPQFLYRHKWQAGDLVIWDNRCTMHRATPFAAADHVRDMRRTTIVERAADVLVG